MRIAVDATPAVRQTAGIGRYVRELVGALVRRGAHEYVLFVADRMPEQRALERLGLGPDKLGRARVRITGIPERAHAAVWYRAGLPAYGELWLGRTDLFHATDFLAPPLRRTPSVITVHDLSFLRFPQRAEPTLRDYLTRAVPIAASRARHILADSESTGHDLEDLLSVPSESITIAYPGVTAGFDRSVGPDAIGRVRAEHRLARPYILGVGTLEPRKDWPTLIAAFDRLGEQATDLELVIAGRHGWLTESIKSAAARSDGGVRLLGFVDEADLPALFAGASAFAYPSVYEGFGLPPLEALACGVPTVVSNSSSLPEVVGDAALLVAPGDVEALAQALVQLLTDEDLRRHLSVAGPRQAARFTWDKCAAAVESAYERALSAP